MGQMATNKQFQKLNSVHYGNYMIILKSLALLKFMSPTMREPPLLSARDIDPHKRPQAVGMKEDLCIFLASLRPTLDEDDIVG